MRYLERLEKVRLLELKKVIRWSVQGYYYQETAHKDSGGSVTHSGSCIQVCTNPLGPSWGRTW